MNKQKWLSGRLTSLRSDGFCATGISVVCCGRSNAGSCLVLKPADTLVLPRPSGSSHKPYTSAVDWVWMVGYLGMFLHSCLFCSLISEEPTDLLLAPEFVTFPEFLLHDLFCHSPKSHRHLLSQPRCQEDSSQLECLTLMSEQPYVQLIKTEVKMMKRVFGPCLATTRFPLVKSENHSCRH